MTSLPTYDDVAAAAQRIQGHAHHTPVLTSRTLDDALGARVFLKCENLQRMGAFKFRGAFNALSRFSPAQRRAGVVAFSSGNHAQAIALAARLLEIPATIVMPHDAPAAKVAATKGYGGQVVVYDRYTEDREQIGRDLAERHGLTLIPPYDHAECWPARARPPRNCSRKPARWTPSSCRWAAGACCRAPHCPRMRSAPSARSTAWSPRPATMASSRCAQAASST